MYHLSYLIISSWFTALKPEAQHAIFPFILQQMNQVVKKEPRCQEDVDLFVDFMTIHLIFATPHTDPHWKQSLHQHSEAGIQQVWSYKNVIFYQFPNHVILSRAHGTFLLPTIADDSMESISERAFHIPYKETPVVLQHAQPAFQRAFAVLEALPNVFFGKVGVLLAYAQQQECAILSNRTGPLDYYAFLNDLGTHVPLLHTPFFVGGLDTRDSGSDGTHALVYQNEMNQCVFHVASWMPNHPDDPSRIKKKRHIGNDAVNIVFLASGTVFAFDVLASDFNLVQIIVQRSHTCRNNATPFAKRIYSIRAQCKQGIELNGPLREVRLCVGSECGAFVRQMSLHALNFVKVLLEKENFTFYYKERLRCIKLITERCV